MVERKFKRFIPRMLILEKLPRKVGKKVIGVYNMLSS